MGLGAAEVVLIAGVLACVACVDDRPELFPSVAAGAPTYEATQPGAPGTGVAGGGDGTPTGPAQPGADEAGVTGALPIEGQPTPASGIAGSGAVPGTAPAEPVQPTPPPVQDVNSARACPAITEPVLLDFDVAGNGAEQAVFGDFNLLLSGGTFVFPQLSVGALAADPAAVGVESNVTEGDWHIRGNVSQPSGFGLFFNCQRIDASAFVGIAFRVQGSVALGSTLAVQVGSASQEVSHDWFVQQGNGSVASFGRCFPVASQYDGTCQAPSVSVPVTAEGSDVIVPFTDFINGQPVAGIDPVELTSLQWMLPAAELDSAGAAIAYAIDLHIDDIRFVTSLTPEPPEPPEPPAPPAPPMPDPNPPAPADAGTPAAP
jgi:hypothetical protein